MQIKSEALPRYILKETYSDGGHIEIDSEKYKTLQSSIQTLVSAIDIEEAFQVYAQSFLNYEKDLLNIAFEHAYLDRNSTGFSEFSKKSRVKLNVSIMTILTAYRTFDDICRSSSGDTEFAKIRDFDATNRAQAYDGSRAYRICCALRDHAQHRGLPLGGFSIGGKTNLGESESGKLVKLDTPHLTSASLNTEKLINNPKIKPEIRNELSGLKCREIDMTWLLRAFAEAMSKRHSRMRHYLTPIVEKCGNEVRAAYEWMSAKKGKNVMFLDLISGSERRHMKKELSDIVISSFKDDKSLGNATRRYVTSQLTHTKGVYMEEFKWED